MNALGVVGYHHSGKTSIVTALIKALSERSLRLASIKDIHSEKYRADTPGKNSALHIEAGSLQTFARGLQDTALIFPTQLALGEMIPHLTADFLIIEGMKDAAVPKIVCAASTSELDELLDDSTIAIGGLISEQLQSYQGIRIFNFQRDIDDLVSQVLTKTFPILPMSDPECCSRCGSNCVQMAKDIVQGRRKREDCILDSQKRIVLEVAGKEISIVPFVQDILRDSILAILKNLKDTDTERDIHIHIKA